MKNAGSMEFWRERKGWGSKLMANEAGTWWDQVLQQVQDSAQSALLKDASLAGNLFEWTRLTAEAVVWSCEARGWEAAARGHRLARLPEPGEEYLSVDVMAFPVRAADERWALPIAVFELENSPRDDRVAYSLWKVLCVRASLRVVFAYRKDWEQARKLVDHLGADVIKGLPAEQRMALGGETAIVTGSRGEGETFPYGYFKHWLLDANLGKFNRM
jgi:hypothetical protein